MRLLPKGYFNPPIQHPPHPHFTGFETLETPPYLDFPLKWGRLCFEKATETGKIHAGDSLLYEPQYELTYPAPLDGRVEVHSHFIRLSPSQKEALPLPPLSDLEARETLLHRIAESGIVGLGGGGFPTYLKGRYPCHTLLINATECEPFAGTDRFILLEESGLWQEGTRLLSRVCGAKRALLVTERGTRLPKNLPKWLEIKQVVTGYPSGSEQQIARSLLSITRQEPLVNQGILCVNINTARAVAETILQGKRLTHRLITCVKGKSHRLVKTPIGTPVQHLLKHLDWQGESVVLGGLMMSGKAIQKGAVITPLVSLLTLWESADDKASEPCIRCGACVDACPVGLMPQELFRINGGELDNARKSRLITLSMDSCLLCGACEFVCPSRLPLTETFLSFKEKLAHERGEEVFRARSKKRGEQKTEREIQANSKATSLMSDKQGFEIPNKTPRYPENKASR